MTQFFNILFNVIYFLLSPGGASKYSHLSNKSGEDAKVAKSINVEVGILQLESSPFVFK